MTYCLDTSALITGWRDTYPVDLFPRLWVNVEALIDDERRAVAPDEVLDELARKEDDLAAWARDREGMFLPLESEVQEATREILATHPRLVDTVRGRGRADPFVIAVARVRGIAVVTAEGRGSETRPKIPDVCEDYGVPCMTLLDLIRTEGWAF